MHRVKSQLWIMLNEAFIVDLQPDIPAVLDFVYTWQSNWFTLTWALIVSDHIKWLILLESAEPFEDGLLIVTSHPSREQWIVWTLYCEKQWYLMLSRFRYQCCLMLLLLLHWWMVSSVQHILCSIIFVKSETPHYTQTTYAHMTCSLITPSRCATLNFMLNYWPCVKCGRQDVMSHSMASVLVIRMQETGYDVSIASVLKILSSTAVW